MHHQRDFEIGPGCICTSDRTYFVQCKHSYLCVVQESIDIVDVGVWSYHYSMGGDSGQVTVSVLRDLGLSVLRTEQLEICRVEIYCPRLTRVTW